MVVLAEIESYVLDLVSDALVDEGARVVFGYAEAPELVAIFGSEFERDFRLLGPNPVPLEEAFRIDFVIEVLRPSGRDMKPAADRVWELFDLVDNALRGDFHIGEFAFDSRFAKGTREFFQTDKKQGARIRATLTGTARI